MGRGQDGKDEGVGACDERGSVVMAGVLCRAVLLTSSTVFSQPTSSCCTWQCGKWKGRGLRCGEKCRGGLTRVKEALQLQAELTV